MGPEPNPVPGGRGARRTWGAAGMATGSVPSDGPLLNRMVQVPPATRPLPNRMVEVQSFRDLLVLYCKMMKLNQNAWCACRDHLLTSLKNVDTLECVAIVGNGCAKNKAQKIKPTQASNFKKRLLQ